MIRPVPLHCFLLGLAACVSCDRQPSGPATPSAKATLKIGYVLHGLNDFTQVIKKGAEDAGRELGVDVEVTGPAGFVPTEAIGMFEAMMQKRKDGVVVVPQPGDVWVVPINQAAATGTPILTANVTSPGAKATAWFGQDEYQSGVTLARELRKILEAAGKTEGKIVAGVCLPGVVVLLSRYEGFKKGMEGTRFELSPPHDVTPENTSNYSAWENLIGASRDVVAAVGFCSLDIPNLAKLKQRSGGAWLIAGYDLNVETLEAVDSGAAAVTVGQHPYLQGYLPVRALVEHLRDRKPLVKGWVDVGTEVVTRANAATLLERERDEPAETRWYAAYTAERFKDLNSLARPLPGEGSGAK